MPTKIETHLTPEQFQEFCARVAALKGGTRLRSIQALAEEFGVSVSLDAASTFAKGPLADYLAELKAKREIASQIATIAQGGVSTGDAAAAVITQKLLDQSLALDADDEQVLGKTNAISLALSRMRLGDQRAKLLQGKLDQLEREKIEWEESRSKAKAALEAALKPTEKGGVSADTLKRVAEAIKLL